MNLTTFLEQRRPEWKALEALLEHVEGSGLAALDDDQAVEFGRLYRRAASDLNQAQTFVSGEATERYLNDLVARAYLAIYGKSRVDLWAPLRYLVREYPAVFRRCLPQLLLATALFAGGTLFGFVGSRYDAEVARAYLLPTDMPVIQPSRDGEGEQAPVQTTGEFTAFSSHLFTNN